MQLLELLARVARQAAILSGLPGQPPATVSVRQWNRGRRAAAVNGLELPGGYRVIHLLNKAVGKRRTWSGWLTLALELYPPENT
jgi:hypothetical protein